MYYFTTIALQCATVLLCKYLYSILLYDCVTIDTVQITTQSPYLRSGRPLPVRPPNCQYFNPNYSPAMQNIPEFIKSN